MGLLGVCFGDVLAIDTPKAQSGEEYNWAQTLWHEIAHVTAVGVSDHKVPRWFTEGLSVYEEMLARPQWKRKMDLHLYSALDKGKLLRFRDINQGFTRPEFPGQVILTYYQSARWIEFISAQFGFEAIIDLLIAFKENRTLDEAFKSVLKTDLDDLEKTLFEKLQAERNQYDTVMKDLPPLMTFGEEEDIELLRQKAQISNPYFSRVYDGFNRLQQDNYTDAERLFQGAIELFPNYAQSPSPYEGLAAVYRKQNDMAKLKHTLTRYLTVSEYGAPQARELADIFLAEGDTRQAIFYLNQSLEVAPYDIDARSKLAKLFREQNELDKEIAERQAILALNPVDKSTAFYELALSLYNSGQKTAAKQHTLRSLDLAPGFREAQKLLLKCVEARN